MRAVSKIERLTVTLFNLELPLTAPLGNSTTYLIMTGRCRAFQWYNIQVCVGGAILIGLFGGFAARLLAVHVKRLAVHGEG